MCAEFKSTLYDPNPELPEVELQWALLAGGGPFRRCRLSPRRVSVDQCPTLVYGEMGTKKYVVYVRVTHAENEEEGTGPMPLALINAAQELGAEPHIVRVNMTPVGDGIAFKYWGAGELERVLKSNTNEWHRILLNGKTVADFARLAGGKINRLALTLNLPERLPENPAGLDINIVLTVDGRPVTKHRISLFALAKSCHQSDEHWIFTCSCGTPECAGIYRGVTVVTEQGVTVWKAYGTPPRRVFIFDHQQYRTEILAKLREFIAWLSKLPKETAYDVYFTPIEYLREALYGAEEGEPAVSGRNMGPLWVRDGIPPGDD